MVLQARDQHEPKRRRRRVERLKETTAKSAVINHPRARDHAKLCRRIDPALPLTAAIPIKILWMAAHEHGFGFAIAVLLAQVIAHRRTAIMPDKTSGAEPDLISALLQPPADVHVISGFAKERVEATELQKCPSIKRHVAAGNVLRQS